MKKWLVLLLLLPGLAWSQVPERPNPPRLYNNFSQEQPDFLNAQEAAQFESELVAFNDSTSNQICVVVVDDLGGMDPSTFAFEVGNKWAVGQGSFNNGIVILIKPTSTNGRRELFIATGSGLEGAIPDIYTARVREEMVPYLKAGENLNALEVGTGMLIKMARGEFHEKLHTKAKQSGMPWWAVLIILVVVLVIMARGGGGSAYSGRGRKRYWGGYGGFGGGIGGGGSWGGGNSGSSGGFGGFGGGSFGGGGSGGSW
jgi:uncharacterized protein